MKLAKILSRRLTNKTEIKARTANSVYVAIAGEVVNRRSVLLRNFVLSGQESASNPLLHIHANRCGTFETNIGTEKIKMKQNKYDDNNFFESYGKMPRSIDGLNSAGEWYILRKMLPEFQGKNVLDLGCGYGWHCIYAKQQGAENVIGIDLSQKMIDKAKENSKDLAIDYKQMAIEDINFEPERFDVVFSSLAFHYLKELKTVFRKINQTLKKGGSFVFSMEHPVFTSRAEQDWFTDESENRLHWPIDNYQDESKRKSQFLGHKVTKYHRTLETIINTVIQSNFDIREISEPKPSEEILKKYPEMKDEMRRPIFIMISAIKK